MDNTTTGVLLIDELWTGQLSHQLPANITGDVRYDVIIDLGGGNATQSLTAFIRIGPGPARFDPLGSDTIVDGESMCLTGTVPLNATSILAEIVRLANEADCNDSNVLCLAAELPVLIPGHYEPL